MPNWQAGEVTVVLGHGFLQGGVFRNDYPSQRRPTAMRLGLTSCGQVTLSNRNTITSFFQALGNFDGNRSLLPAIFLPRFVKITRPPIADFARRSLRNLTGRWTTSTSSLREMKNCTLDCKPKRARIQAEPEVPRSIGKKTSRRSGTAGEHSCRPSRHPKQGCCFKRPDRQ